MCIGAVTYICYIFSFLYPVKYVVYTMSAVLGIGAAFIWTGQGNYLIINTPIEKMSRNSGIFWATSQLSMIIGTTIIYFLFSGMETVNTKTRVLVISILSGIALFSFILFVSLPGSVRQDDISTNKEDKPGPIEVLRGAGRLFRTKHILLLCVAFLYGGLELAFFSGVYGSSVGFTLQLHDSKSLIGLCGILIGCGEVLGGTLFGVFGAYTSKIGRSTIVIFGCVLHLITYGLVFVNLPNNSPFGDTRDEAIIPSSAVIAAVCGFTLGFADACFNNQFYTAIGTNYPNNSASVFAIFKCVQSSVIIVGILSVKKEVFFSSRSLLGGLELAFFSGVYGSSVGFTLNLHDSKSLIGLCGILIGSGEVLGGILFGVFGAYTSKIGRSTIVIFGCILHLATYALVFVNLPNNSPFGDTRDEAIITSSAAIAAACGFCLGFADACFNNQFYTSIGTNYPNNSASVFAIFRFVQSIGGFIGFMYSTHLIMYGNLGLLSISAVIGTICFVVSEKVEVNEEEAVRYRNKMGNGSS